MIELYNMKETIKLIERHVSETQIDRHQGLNALCDFLIGMFDVRHYLTADGFIKNCIRLSEQASSLYKVSVIWLEKVAKAMEQGSWIDFFGGIYEEMYQSKGKASTLGQFFTPAPVCDLMAKMTVSSGRQIVNDCACGSGRTLVSSFAAAGYPHDAYYIGDDVDTASVKMCALNMMAHGMKGRVTKHDTLTQPYSFDWGYEVNEVRYPFPVPFYSIRYITYNKEEEERHRARIRTIYGSDMATVAHGNDGDMIVPSESKEVVANIDALTDDKETVGCSDKGGIQLSLF